MHSKRHSVTSRAGQAVRSNQDPCCETSPATPPSDLEVPEGEHSITVKKTGYKNWERKMKLVAGSNIRLNAEMQKTTTP